MIIINLFLMKIIIAIVYSIRYTRPVEITQKEAVQKYFNLVFINKHLKTEMYNVKLYYT